MRIEKGPGKTQISSESTQAQRPPREGTKTLGTPLAPLAKGALPSLQSQPGLGQSAVALRASMDRRAGEPLRLEGAAGRSAVNAVLAALPASPTGVDGHTSNYRALTAEVDELGTTHVRLQRCMGERPVFGEHVTAQIDDEGQVSFHGTPPVALQAEAPMAISYRHGKDEALAMAKKLVMKMYSMGEGMQVVSAEPVLARKPEESGGALYPAWHVTMADFVGPGSEARAGAHEKALPTVPNVIIHAETGEIMRHWNQLERRGVGHSHGHSHPAHGHRDINAEQSVDVRLPFGRGSASVELNFERDLEVEQAILRLGDRARPGIEHAWRGDVVIRVTSPAGTSAEITPFGPNDSRDDVSGDFDLSEVFAGEPSMGTWTVRVEDRFPAADDGVVRSIALNLDGPAIGEEPEPIEGAGDDFAPFVGRVDLATTPTARGFQLLSPDGRVETRDARAQDPNRVSGRFDLGVPFIDEDDRWGGADGTIREWAAVETHHAATTFLPFLEEVFGLDSLDNRGLPLRALSNVGTRYNNAFWFADMFHIGHGDGQTFDRLSTVDIVGHELAHGITQKSADLIYAEQSGGLNESYSDIVGTLFEWWQANQPGAADAGVLPFDWKVGEDSFTPGGDPNDALRSMSDPLTDGRSIDHASLFRRGMGVHFSSGVQNNAFYLAVEGGTHRLGAEVPGLKDVFGDFDTAMLAGGRIWMRALRFYMTPSTNFEAARVATLRSAQDLFPDNPAVADSINRAWTAVGVGPRLQA